MKPDLDRKPLDDGDDELGHDLRQRSDASAWYRRDERTCRLAALVGAGYGFVSIEIAYTLREQPETRRTALWVGFDVQPNFPHFRQWLAQWEEKQAISVLDMRAGVVDLVTEQEIALNPSILHVH